MKNKKGFTLIELLSVIFILGILLLIAIPAAQKYLNKGTKTYYQNLEKTVLLAGKEYLNDYKVLLPRVIGNVEVIELNELTSNKYIKDVVDHNNKECTATVTVKKIADSKYEYYSCLKCEGYESTSENCGFNEDDNVAAGSEGYSIVVEKDYYKVAQGSDFDLPIGQVYYKGEQVATAIAKPKVVDTNILGTNEITYSYKQIKKIITVEVVDMTSPSKPTVSLIKDTSGYYYRYDSDCDEGWSNESIYQKFNSTDYTKPNLLGSGIDYYAISTDNINYTKVTSASNSLAGIVITSTGVNYLTTTSNGQYTLYVKSVDKAGNWSEATEYSFKIDKENPKIKASVSSKTVTLTLTDNLVVAGYTVNQSTTVPTTFTSISSCTKGTNIAYSVEENGTYYAWVKDGAGNVFNQSFEVTGTCNTNESWDFAYNGTNGYDGSVQEFLVPNTGIYKLEVWGASGDGTYSSYNYGQRGYGGYSYGNMLLTEGNKLYVYVGGAGTTKQTTVTDSDGDTSKKYRGGYNGGGMGHPMTWYEGGRGDRIGAGGGATHIATTDLGELPNYNSYRSDVLIVAGGGGGVYHSAASGEGYNTDDMIHYYPSSGGGSKIAKRREVDYDYEDDSVTKVAVLNPIISTNFGTGSDSGGGGGWYGGGGQSGGTGYIGNNLLSNAGMYTYCGTTTYNNKTRNYCRDNNEYTTSTTNVSTTATSNYAKSGDGYARITLLSCDDNDTIPNVSASVSNSTVTLTLSDDNGVVAYGVNQSSTTEPTYNSILSTTSTTQKWIARSTGTYYVWVKDGAGQTNKTSFTISTTGASNLKDTIMTDNNISNYMPPLEVTSNNGHDPAGLYKSTDTNSGNPTYYFRGNVTNNYVSFAGFTWRIIRINEDGTIRLIMDGDIGSKLMNGSNNQKKHMFYSYNGVTSDGTKRARVTLNDWYKTNITNKGYSTKVASGDYFCEMYNEGDPTFKCSRDSDGYGGFVNTSSLSGLITEALSVGLITKDEVVFAGGINGKNNKTYYLYSGNAFYTMSPSGETTDSEGDAYYSIWRVNGSGQLVKTSPKTSYKLRPVINLISTVTATGTGTSSDPYVIQ